MSKANLGQEWGHLQEEQECAEQLCARRSVMAGTYALERGKLVFVVAQNECAGMITESVGEPRMAEYEYVCPTQEKKHDGSGHTMRADCGSTHAEAALARHMKEKGLTSEGGVAWVYGHYWACRDCARALREVGVKEVRVRESI